MTMTMTMITTAVDSWSEKAIGLAHPVGPCGVWRDGSALEPASTLANLSEQEDRRCYSKYEEPIRGGQLDGVKR